MKETEYNLSTSSLLILINAFLLRKEKKTISHIECGTVSCNAFYVYIVLPKNLSYLTAENSYVLYLS